MTCPPQDTRAFLRGLFVSRFGTAVRSIGWNGVAFQHADEDFIFDMNPLVESNVAVLNDEMSSVQTVAEAVEVIRRKPAE